MVENEEKTESLGSWLKEHRRLRGMTQDTVGRLAGIDRQQVYRLENGLSRTKRETIIAIADALKADRDTGLRLAGFFPEGSSDIPFELCGLEYFRLSPLDLAEIREIIILRIKYAAKRKNKGSAIAEVFRSEGPGEEA